MYTITYNLRDDRESASAFYLKLRDYAHKVYEELDEQLYETVMSYFRYRRHEGLGQVYSLQEAYLELLSLGVYWTIYSGDAEATEPSTNEFLQSLVSLREINKQLKPLVDAFRGICLTAMMSPDLYDHIGIARPCVESFEQLLMWLEATGEFEYDAKRLKHWLLYAKTLSEEKANELLEWIVSLGLWFETDSAAHLGGYTENVDRYLNELRPKRYWKEDVIFCGRRRAEYHLNFVGSAWLNEAYRDAFIKREEKIVIMPTCMRIRQDDDCKASKVGDWLACTGCDPSCQVNQIRELEAVYNFKHFMVAHNMTLKNAPENIFSDKSGIVGISCALNLLSGGWMLAERDIPAQCVVLDYCGCKSHWHAEGMPTAIDINELKRVLEHSEMLNEII